MDWVPKVSVCIPTYNRAGFLRQSIASVLKQDFGDFELLVFDAASEDETAQVIGEFQDSRLRYVQTQEKMGWVKAHNRCLELAQGRYVGILHDDDWYLDGFLTEGVTRLNQDPSLGLVFCAYQMVDGHGTFYRVAQTFPEGRTLSAQEMFQRLLISCCIKYSACLVRRACYDQAGYFDEGLMGSEWDMWLRMAEAGWKFGYVAKALAAYRTHEDSLTAEATRAYLLEKIRFQIVEKVLRRLPSGTPYGRALKRMALSQHSQWVLQKATEIYRAGNLRGVREYLFPAFRRDPSFLFQGRAWALLFLIGLPKGWDRSLVKFYQRIRFPGMAR